MKKTVDTFSPNPKLTAEILEHAKDGKLPCALAFEIGQRLDIPPAEIGKTLDAMNIRLIKCQLGLFGYSPEKKIVKPQTEVRNELKQGLETSLIDGKLSCIKAWELAQQFHIPKLALANACEMLKLKIKPCQLGAF